MFLSNLTCIGHGHCKLMYNCFKPFSSNIDIHLFRKGTVNCGTKESALDCGLLCSTNVAIRFSACRKYDTSFRTSFTNFLKWYSCGAHNDKNSNHMRIQLLENSIIILLILIWLILIFSILFNFILKICKCQKKKFGLFNI
jgi:hypothetical protein